MFNGNSRDSLNCRRPFCQDVISNINVQAYIDSNINSAVAKSASIDYRTLSGVAGCPCKVWWNYLEVVAELSAGPCLAAGSCLWPCQQRSNSTQTLAFPISAAWTPAGFVLSWSSAHPLGPRLLACVLAWDLMLLHTHVPGLFKVPQAWSTITPRQHINIVPSSRLPSPHLEPSKCWNPQACSICLDMRSQIPTCPCQFHPLGKPTPHQPGTLGAQV